MFSKQWHTHTDKTPHSTAIPVQPTAPHHVPAEAETPGEHLAGQIARGAASGVTRSVTDWIIEQLTENFG
ncbi:hypothetical protein [Streptomyces sp. NRRL B-24484]|uniref:hypothetical protein n=1 Tax=Streptomyces sp. NRRL B-24484 TaxID=1463833 RepID=UPI0004C04625|nr:hypothetical protein [Streptomyces sp. NRRL B-24484]